MFQSVWRHGRSVPKCVAAWRKCSKVCGGMAATHFCLVAVFFYWCVFCCLSFFTGAHTTEQASALLGCLPVESLLSCHPLAKQKRPLLPFAPPPFSLLPSLSKSSFTSMFAFYLFLFFIAVRSRMGLHVEKQYLKRYVLLAFGRMLTR